MGYLGATLTQVFARARSRRVTQRCPNSPRWETGLASTNDVTHWKRAENFGNLKKVSKVEICLERRRLVFACSRRPWAGVTRDGGGRWKGQNRKIVPLSPYVEKPFKPKGNKKFRTWTEKSLRIFRASRFLCSMLYIYIYMNIICPFHAYLYLAMVHWCPWVKCKSL